MSVIRYYKPKIREYDQVYRPVDIQETEDEYIFEVELPGFTTNEIDIEAAADELIISAEKVTEELEKTEDEETEETQSTKPRYIKKERVSGKFVRKFSFRKPVKPTEAKTVLQNGILTVTLPKAEESKAIKLIPETN